MFHAWEDFFLLVGTAAGGLIGLLFVVSTLTAGAQSGRAQRGAKLFMTPCVFHFAVIMSISAAAMVPIATSQAVGAVLTTAAFVGLIYMARIMSSLRKGDATEHWTDFWYYGAAPFACYMGLAAIAAGVWFNVRIAPASVGTFLLVLLLLGIRNAWDLVTWIAPRVEEIKAEADGGRTAQT